MLPVGAFAGGAAVHPDIAFVGWDAVQAVADLDASSAQVDDVMIHFAGRTADNSAITFPGGDYKQPAVAGLITAVNLSIATAYALADYKVSDEAGTETFQGSLFTLGNSQVLGIYRNVDKTNPILAQKFFSGTGNPITLPSLSHNDANATIFFAMRTANAVTATTGPVGFTMRTNSSRRIAGDKPLVANYAGESFSADTGPGVWIGVICALKRA